MDKLINRDCAILDGNCNCIKLPGNFLPECKLIKEKNNDIIANRDDATKRDNGKQK